MKKPRLEDDLDDAGIERHEILEAPEINDLVHEELAKSAANLEVLSKDHLFGAVNQFVDKVCVCMYACPCRTTTDCIFS